MLFPWRRNALSEFKAFADNLRKRMAIKIARTSYIAVYRVDDQTVSVTRVLHSRQNWPSE